MFLSLEKTAHFDVTSGLVMAVSSTTTLLKMCISFTNPLITPCLVVAMVTKSVAISRSSLTDVDSWINLLIFLPRTYQ